jgi:hypothetical protein
VVYKKDIREHKGSDLFDISKCQIVTMRKTDTMASLQLKISEKLGEPITRTR